MRVLAIVAGSLLIAASLCSAQSAPAPAAPVQASPAAQDNLLLREQLEDLKVKYGKAQLDESRVTEIVLQPKPGRQTLNLTGDVRTVYNAIATAFGVRATFDDSTPNRSLRFNLEKVDFNTAMDTAAMMSKTFWFPAATDRVLISADTTQKRHELEPMLERTFYLSDAATAQDITDVVNTLRTIFEIRFIVQQPGSSSITIRTEQRTMHNVEKLLDDLNLSRPQVMLDVQAFEVDSSMQRKLGINLPLQFQMFNIPVGVLALLNTPNLQSLIQQLGAGGLSSLANNSAVAALLAQNQNQLKSLLANPIATFGGGLTFMGVSVPPLTANFSRNESHATSLEDLTLQASDGNPATIHIGNRYPVLTQSFSSGINIPGLNLGLGGAIPGFTYEDLGVSLKAKPKIHGTSAVTLDMEVSIKSLGATRLNGIPVIQNREYKGVITVKEGEPAVIAGMISKTEQKSLSGPPGLGSLPVLNKLLAGDTVMDDRTELIIIITPHITRARIETDAPPIVVAPGH
jgi:type II secretory pathway component GspD/PulD (secretin)